MGFCIGKNHLIVSSASCAEESAESSHPVLSFCQTCLRLFWYATFGDPLK